MKQFLHNLPNSLKGAWLALSVFFTLWNLFLSFKNDKDSLSIQWRYIYLIVTILCVTFIILGVIIHNQNKQLLSLGHYHIEDCRVEYGRTLIFIEYMPFLAFDYAVTIATIDDKREKVLGIGKVINVQLDNYIEIEVVHKEKNSNWDALECGNKKALDNSYILPIIKANEVRNYGK